MTIDLVPEQHGIWTVTYQELLARCQTLQDQRDTLEDENESLQNQLDVANAQAKLFSELYDKQRASSDIVSKSFEEWTVFWHGDQELSRVESSELRERLAQSEANLAEEQANHAQTKREARRLQDERDTWLPRIQEVARDLLLQMEYLMDILWHNAIPFNLTTTLLIARRAVQVFALQQPTGIRPVPNRYDGQEQKAPRPSNDPEEHATEDFDDWGPQIQAGGSNVPLYADAFEDDGESDGMADDEAEGMDAADFDESMEAVEVPAMVRTSCVYGTLSGFSYGRENP